MARTRRNHPDRRVSRIRAREGLNFILRAGPILLVAALLALVALKSSMAGVFQESRPARALTWQPNHAGASISVAHRLATADRGADARRMAQAAIARSAMDAAAYSALALAAESEGRPEDAARLMMVSHAMSRRERQTQVWLIRQGIATGDFDAAVRHFDLAMRTSARRSADLMPLLIAATADRRVLPPLAAVLARDPVWKMQFLLTLAASGPNSSHVALLSRGRLDPGLPGERAVQARLIQRLVDDRRYDLAWSIYREARRGTPDSAAAMLRDPQYGASGGFPPFDWQLADQPGLAALREPRRDGGDGFALALAADGGRTGEVARQLIRLPPGTYQISFETGSVAEQPTERPQVSVSCAGSADPFFSVRPSRGGGARQVVGGSFNVPAGCRWQWVSVRIGSGDTPTDFAWVANITIRRAS